MSVWMYMVAQRMVTAVFVGSVCVCLDIGRSVLEVHITLVKGLTCSVRSVRTIKKIILPKYVADISNAEAFLCREKFIKIEFVGFVVAMSAASVLANNSDMWSC